MIIVVGQILFRSTLTEGRIFLIQTFSPSHLDLIELKEEHLLQNLRIN